MTTQLERLQTRCKKSRFNDNTCIIFFKDKPDNYCCIYCEEREPFQEKK